MATSGNFGAFVPTSFTWEISQLYSLEVTSPEFKELLVRLYQNLNLMALVLNVKDSGYYVQEEFVNGQLWFPNPANNSSTQASPSFRQDFRKLINFGALPNNTTKSVPHGITFLANTDTPPNNNGSTMTNIIAVASDTTNRTYIKLPYASATTADIIEINVDDTYVNITTNSDKRDYNVCYVVLEYLQS